MGIVFLALACFVFGLAIAPILGPTNYAPVPATALTYTVVETKSQPLIDQFLVQVVVPEGSTFADVQNVHREIQREYKFKASRLFVNYYGGSYDINKTLASDGGSGKLVWIKSE